MTLVRHPSGQDDWRQVKFREELFHILVLFGESRSPAARVSGGAEVADTNAAPTFQIFTSQPHGLVGIVEFLRRFRVVDLWYLIEGLAFIFQSRKAAGTSLRQVGHGMVFSRQNLGHPILEGRRLPAQINHHIMYRSPSATDQFGLRVWRRFMRSSDLRAGRISNVPNIFVS